MKSFPAWIASLLLLAACAPLAAQPAIMLKDINAGNGNGSIDHYSFGDIGTGADFSLRKVGDVALFPADDGIHGLELWASDGTAAGTRLVKDLCPGACDSFGFNSPWNERVVLGGRLVFAGLPPPFGITRIWSSDGTAAGTYRLPDAGASRGIVPWGSSAASSRVSPVGLYRSDGTLAGTTSLDPSPVLGSAGLLPSSPFAFQIAGPYLHFTANDGVHGFEPWSVPLSALPGTAIFSDGFESGGLSAWSAASF